MSKYLLDASNLGLVNSTRCLGTRDILKG